MNHSIDQKEPKMNTKTKVDVEKVITPEAIKILKNVNAEDLVIINAPEMTTCHDAEMILDAIDGVQKKMKIEFGIILIPHSFNTEQAARKDLVAEFKEYARKNSIDETPEKVIGWFGERRETKKSQ